MNNMKNSPEKQKKIVNECLDHLKTIKQNIINKMKKKQCDKKEINEMKQYFFKIENEVKDCLKPPEDSLVIKK